MRHIMRSILNVSILGILVPFVIGCGSTVSSATPSSRDAKAEDASSYLFKLEAELADLASTRYSEGGGSQNRNIKTSESSFIVANTEFSPDELTVYAERALAKWDEFERFSARGTGSSGHLFELHFGNQKTHVFIDLIASSGEDVTTIDCLVRAVE